MGFTLLFAQMLEPISGGGGWVGAGLLGLVLCWLLLVHLPNKDRQLKEIMSDKDDRFFKLIEAKDVQMKEALDGKDEQIKSALTDARDTVNGLTITYSTNLKEVTAHCQKELASIAVTFQREVDRIVDVLRGKATMLKNVAIKKTETDV